MQIAHGKFICQLAMSNYSIPVSSLKDCLGRPRLRSLRELRRGRPMNRLAAPKRRQARRRGPQAPSLPVVIGSGSHPFPFRTRKLSLIPPMVLHGKLCGRVGRCRHYSAKGPIVTKTVGPFLFRIADPGLRILGLRPSTSAGRPDAPQSRIENWRYDDG